MRSLGRARERARACRAAVGAPGGDLLARVGAYLEAAHGVELVAVGAAFLGGGRAEVVPAEGCLYYDERFDRDPAAKLLLLLHELGHLELHRRLKRSCTAGDPLAGSMYLGEGGPALARYNRRAREEAEANAFATEFACPADELFARWLADARADSRALADAFEVPAGVVQAQLAEALYRVAHGAGGGEARPRPEFACDAAQERAARFTGAPALVDAGPGTGKTATLVRRAEYLIKELGAAPDGLLVLTFSTHAAEELAERLARRLGADTAGEVAVNTFHGFGLSFLLQHGQHRGVEADACVLDEAGQAELLGRVLGRTDCGRLLDLKRPRHTVEEAARHIAFLKDRLLTPDALAAKLEELRGGEEDDDDVGECARQFLELFRAYEREKARLRRLDFADLIALPAEILEREPAVRAARRARHRWVLVDEYQDVSRSVARLLQLLCGPDNPPWVVGDVRQAIFQFRGAARENVSEFARDFPGASLFALDVNYRSSADVVRAANQLAGLLPSNGEEGSRPHAHGEGSRLQAHGEGGRRWQASPDNPPSIGDAPVAVAVADSEPAEHAGVVAQVCAWLDAGVPPGDIAVLARRNVDVRHVVLALGRRGLRAATSGLATAEGAAGDLANLLTVADRAGPSLPRLAYSLGRGRYDADTINAVVRRLLETSRDDGTFAADGYGEGGGLAAEVARACAALRAGRHAADAFAAMCLFLFDGGDYLRRLLARDDGAEKSLALGEVVTSLARAAVYRFAHRGVAPAVSRRGFAEHFRAALGAGVPCAVPPPAGAGAVRVMTCHAAKGLEFPCVVVAGQTLARAARGYAWLPRAMQPAEAEELEQADALAFVGVTRARRALLVTYAETAGGAGRRAAPRRTTPLVERWREQHRVPTTRLPPVPPARESAAVHALWGGAPDASLSAGGLDRNECPINSYLQEFLGARYPVNEEPLYKVFHAVVRYAMRRVVERAHETGAPVGADEARALFAEGWAASGVEGHAHYALYTRLGAAYVERLARAYVPPPGRVEPLDTAYRDEASGLFVRLDLVAHHRTAEGRAVAVLFRPESLRRHARGRGLLWGALSAGARAPLVLLRLRDPAVEPFVFSGEDGALRPYLWGADAHFAQEAARLRERLAALARARFEERIDPYKCGRCESRLPCPHWLGAASRAG